MQHSSTVFNVRVCSLLLGRNLRSAPETCTSCFSTQYLDGTVCTSAGESGMSPTSKLPLEIVQTQKARKEHRYNSCIIANKTRYGPNLAIPKWYPKFRASLPSTVSPTFFCGLLFISNKKQTQDKCNGYGSCVVHIHWKKRATFSSGPGKSDCPAGKYADTKPNRCDATSLYEFVMIFHSISHLFINI